MHRREEPRQYAFNTRIFMFLIDLDELEEVCKRVPIIGRNQLNLYSFRDSDHIQLGSTDIQQNIRNYLRQQGIDQQAKRIELITHLRCFGHIFNPVCFYVIRDSADAPFAMVAEVRNTFGELKPFLVMRSDDNEALFSASHEKHFYISPFSELDHMLELKLHVPAEKLSLHVRCRHHDADQPFLYASLTGTRKPLNTRSLIASSLRFPFVTLKVLYLIHWHALKLFRLGVPFHRKNEKAHLQTGIYPALKENSK